MVGKFGFGDFYNWQDWNTYFPKFKALNCNVFRLAFVFSDAAQFGYSDENGSFWNDSACEAVIAKAYSYGMKTILDLHLIWCEGYLESQNWINNWKAMAQKFKGDSRIAAFEIYNEPYTAKLSYTQKQLHDRFWQCAQAIWAIDPTRKILWFPACLVWNGGVKDSQTNPAYNHPAAYIDPRIILNSHHWNIGVTNVYSTTAAAKEGVAYLQSLRDQYGLEVMMGETGGATGEQGTVPENPASMQAQIAYVRTFAQESIRTGIGVNYWEATWRWEPMYTTALQGITFPSESEPEPEPEPEPDPEPEPEPEPTPQLDYTKIGLALLAIAEALTALALLLGAQKGA